jgi:hypothetical protein
MICRRYGWTLEEVRALSAQDFADVRKVVEYETLRDIARSKEKQ